MTKVDTLFQRLCHEAVLVCGADFPAIERYVMERIDTLDEVGRERVKRDLEQVLGFQPETRHPGLH